MENYLGCHLVGEMESSKIINEVNLFRNRPDNKCYLIGIKKKVNSDQFFSGDQYLSPINNFTQLKLTLTKNF